jgi:multidrug efflux pump subunit AcrB
MVIATLIFGASLLLVPFIGGEFMPHLDEGALWVRATMPYTISFEEASQDRASDARHFDVVSAGDGRRFRAGTSRRWHRSHRLFQLRVLRWAEALQGQVVERRPSVTKAS